MERRKTKIEILSPVRNRKEITLQCLCSLDRIEKNGLSIHRIIIDDGSTDGTSEAIREQFPDVEIIYGEGNLWCSGAASLGVGRALEYDPDYILLINDDTVFDSNFLQAMVETAEQNEKSVVGGLLLNWDEPHKVFQVGPRWDTWYGGWRHFSQQTVWTLPEKPFEVELIVGNCTLFPATVFRTEGLFASRWLPHFGDAEFTPRLRRRGWRLLIEPRARVFNQPNTPPPRLSEMSLKDLYKALWTNYNGDQNLRNRFVCYWLGAPSRLKAVTAFLVFVTRLGLQGLGVLQRRTIDPNERPFTGLYSSN